MRLLVVSQYYWPEPFRITDIAESLVRRGHRVDVLTSVPNVPQGRFYEGYGWFKRGEKTHNGVRIERVGVVRRGNGNALRLCLNCISYAVGSLFHLPKLNRNRYDAVFVFNNSPVTKILPARWMARRQGIPNVVFLLDIWPQSMFFLLGMKQSDDKTLFRRMAYAISRWLYRSVDLMLLSSRGFEGKLREMGVGCKTAYFPNYAEPFRKTDFPLTRERLGLSPDDFVLGFSGNIGRAQGLELTVQATARLKAGNLKWLIVGDGPELPALRDAAEQANLSEQYVFTGWVEAERLPSYLGLCDALFLPLKDQEVLNLTVPAKLQTYMYAGKPVIAFMNGAGAEMVAESGCGLTAPAESAERLAEAVGAMMALSPEQRDEMGQNGRAYCERHFDRERQIDRLVGLIEQAIADKKAVKNGKR